MDRLDEQERRTLAFSKPYFPGENYEQAEKKTSAQLFGFQINGADSQGSGVRSGWRGSRHTRLSLTKGKVDT